MENTVYQYQQVYGRGEMRENYWFFAGKRISIFVVKLLHISKLKATYWLAFDNLSSNSRFSNCWLILIMRNFPSLFHKSLWEYLLWRLFLKFEVDSLKTKQNKSKTSIWNQTHSSLFQWMNFDSVISMCRLRHFRSPFKKVNLYILEVTLDSHAINYKV